MGRPISNESNLTLDEIAQLKQLFGTAAHAYSVLALQGHVTPYVFGRVWRWDGTSVAFRDVIRKHFNVWKMKHLRDPFEDRFFLRRDDINDPTTTETDGHG